MTKEEVEAEVRSVNAFRRTSRASKCIWCHGVGRQYVPLYGDPALGHADAGPCAACKGTGVEQHTQLRTL